MHVSVENTQGSRNYRFVITIPSKNVEKAIKNELDNLAKKIQVNGFRKGKVPVDIVSQRYSLSVRQDILMSLMKKNFTDAIFKEKINPCGNLNYIPGEYQKGKDFTYSVSFETYSKVNLKNLEKIKIEKPTVSITEKDVNDMLTALVEQQAIWTEKNGKVDVNDRVTIDFIGFENGKEIPGSKVTNFMLVVGQGDIILGLQDHIKGHKTGEEFAIDVIFPKNYHDENLQGKTVQFTIKLKRVEKKELPKVTKEFVRNFGIQDGSIETLRTEILKNMTRELRNVIHKYLISQIVNGLIKINGIEIPPVLIEKEVNSLNFHPTSSFCTNKNQILNTSKELFENQAKNRIGFDLLVGEMMFVYKFKVEESRIKELISEVAFAYEDPSKVIRLYGRNEKLTKKIYQIALEEQVIKKVLEIAKVHKKILSFKEIMNQINAKYICSIK